MTKTGPRRQASMPAAVIAIALTLAAAGQAQQVGRTPVDVQVPHAPAAVTALGRQHLVYELHLTNFGASPVRLVSLEVMDDTGARLDGWDEAQLARRVRGIGRPQAPIGAQAPGPQGPAGVQTPAGEGSSLDPGGRAVVYLWVSLPPGRPAPAAIRHRLGVAAGTDAPSAIDLPPVAVVHDVTAIESPVQGGPWVAVRGPSNASPHRTSIVAAHGRATIPQRFAVDWVRLGENGLPFDGAPDAASRWYGYGQPVHAVADAVVVLARDGAADRVPMTTAPPAVIDAAEATGNVVVLDLGGGRYATYAHLRQGSVIVKAGDRVRIGQPIASIGNSGNTLAPHLHFQLATAVEPLDGEGLPFAVRTMELVGRVPSLAPLLAGTPWRPNAGQPARTIGAELPLENMVLRFEELPKAGVR